MSLFLGKIHYWLFNKILWFEDLESEIIKLAEVEGLDIEKLTKQINLNYGEKLESKNLEDIIDTGNIHGWLQEKIHSSEGRMAAWTSKILVDNPDSLKKIENIYRHQGVKAGKEVSSVQNITNAKEIYNSINDYILDGMPCDRVNEVIVLEDDAVRWKRRICVHKEIWDNENVDVNVFYNLRDLWIVSFVNTINNNFEYTKTDDENYVIKKYKN
ncbi:MAG: hypothetical protein ACRDDE_04285 [Paraclostridium sp.]|uniref:hypothetical protein n=1 Tax=Paraclostridium sp. TaxID=2023273 RepID=UPI003EE68B2B